MNCIKQYFLNNYHLKVETCRFNKDSVVMSADAKNRYKRIHNHNNGYSSWISENVTLQGVETWNTWAEGCFLSCRNDEERRLSFTNSGAWRYVRTISFCKSAKTFSSWRLGNVVFKEFSNLQCLAFLKIIEVPCFLNKNLNGISVP